jgi:hypothetical protein
VDLSSTENSIIHVEDTETKSNNTLIEEATTENPFVDESAKGLLPNGNEEDLFKNALKQNSNRKIAFWEYDDYDKDGFYEAFAFTGEENYGFTYGTLWLINSGGVTVIKDELVCETIFTFILENTKFICISYATVNNYSLMWGISGESSYELPISGVGQKFNLNENGNMLIMQSAFDNISFGEYVSGAHTWKPYYFYYDGGFREYGGSKLSLDDLLAYENAAYFCEEINNENGVIKSILKRKNDIININYTVFERERNIDWNYYITLEINNNYVSFVEKNEGVYLSALVPDIAVY